MGTWQRRKVGKTVGWALPTILLGLTASELAGGQTASRPTASHTATTQPAPRNTLNTDSRAPYVHRITLYDESGKAIDPAKSNVPYSPAATCGKCHPYAAIAAGWHFNGRPAGVANQRPGEPWLLTELQTRTILPISMDGAAGSRLFTHAQLGLSDWQMVQRFGAHTPGGGFGEASKEALDKAREKQRWLISGPRQVDCMYCHAADQQHDPLEGARQIDAQNYKWAPTAALGLATIRGEAKRLPDDWDPEAPPNPDYPNQIPPKIVWDKTKFDADNRVLFNITRRPAPERCYFCHSFREVGPHAADGLLATHDVHLAAGLACVDCHRNELDHMIVRGYGTEAAERNQPIRAVFSCEGCHFGDQAVIEDEDEEAQPESEEARVAFVSAGRVLRRLDQSPNGSEGRRQRGAVLGGRLRAPRPKHAGIPALHFEKLTCTACHTGPWPQMQPVSVQTALAHGLGLTSEHRGADDLPRIIEPIFARQPDGKLAPHRMVWPAYWGRLAADGRVTPLLPETVAKVAGKALPKPPKDAGSVPPLTAEQINAVLTLLEQQKGDDAPVYIANGRLHRRSSAGELETVSHDAAAPCLWPIGHDVRPAAQSLGVRGCTDCHAGDAPFYFAALGTQDDPWQPTPVATVAEFRGDDLRLAQAWGFGFQFRPLFKCVASICTAILALVLLRFGFEALGKGRRDAGTEGRRDAGTEDRRDGACVPQSLRPCVPSSLPTDLTGVEHVFHVLAIAAIVVLAVTGFGPKLWGGAEGGWLLFVHMLAAPVYVLGLTGTVVLWARRCRFSDADPVSAAALTFGQRAMFWFVTAVGFVVLLSILLALYPLVGHAGQEFLRAAHEWSALALVILGVVHTVVSLAADRARRRA
ncbi:MAG: hypothetical protein AB1716_07350 [Planctomycetota bacterium]